MCESEITISADLLKIILWDRAKKYTLWKQFKTYTIIIFSGYAGLLSVVFLLKFTRLSFPFPLSMLLFTFLLTWVGLILFAFIRTYISIRSIKDGFSFYVKLNEDGVETSDQKIPWDNYVFYVEHDDYLEIHMTDKSITFLPKKDDIIDILDYTRTHIKPKSKK